MDESYSHWPTAACRGGGSLSGRTTAGLPPCRTRGEGLAAPLGRRGPEERAAPAATGTASARGDPSSPRLRTARRTRTSPTLTLKTQDPTRRTGATTVPIAQASELLNDKILHSTQWVNRSWRLMVCMENS